MDSPLHLVVVLLALFNFCATSSDPAVELSLAVDAECGDDLASCGLGLAQLRSTKDAQPQDVRTCGKAYQQCGGSTNPATGPTCCEAGLHCQIKDSYFSQCLPSSDHAPETSPGAADPRSSRAADSESAAPAPESQRAPDTPRPEHNFSAGKRHAGYTCPMIPYDGPARGAASCFCHKAGNPVCRDKPCTCREGCEEGAVSQHRETVTFVNTKKVSHCSSNSSILTIPRTYFRDMADLLKKCSSGIEDLLQTMFVNGASAYTKQTSHVGPVMQCIHKPGHISVPWLHLHTFCPSGRVDGMPNKNVAMCKVMNNEHDAAQVAQHFVKWLITET